MTSRTLEEEAIQRWNGREPFYEDGPGGQFVTFEDHQIAMVAAATAREKEIEELRAKLASMREPIWMLREEHEREIEELRARVKELEGMVPRWVPWDSDERRNLVKAGWGGIGGDELINDKWHRLMVPPIPLPGEKRDDV